MSDRATEALLRQSTPARPDIWECLGDISPKDMTMMDAAVRFVAEFPEAIGIAEGRLSLGDARIELNDYIAETSQNRRTVVIALANQYAKRGPINFTSLGL